MLFEVKVDEYRLGEFISLTYSAEAINEVEGTLKSLEEGLEADKSYYINVENPKEYFKSLGCDFYVYDRINDLHLASREIPFENF